MSTITYKCNVCKREIDKLENIHGLTVFSKCVITEGCRGNLYKIYRDPSNIRESFPSAQSGVRDYFPRKFFYQHEQTVNSKEWKIFHNLSVSPSVSIYEDTGSGIVELAQDDYTVRVLDKDSLSITFITPKKGICHCIARTSVPTKPKLTSPTPLPYLVSSNTLVTFAVPELISRSNNPDKVLPYNTANETVIIKVEVTRPNEETVTCFEELDDSISETAWLGWNRVLVRNRRHYNLKAKDLTNLRSFSDLDSTNFSVPDGTILRIIEIDYGDGIFQPIPSRGLFILLSVEPYDPADKIRNRLIDVGEMIETEFDYFVFTNNELYTNQTNVESTYPDIKEARGQTPVYTIAPTPQLSQPVPSVTPTQTVTPTVTPTQTATPSVTPTQTITPTITPTNAPPTPSVTPTMTVTPNPTVTPTQTPTQTVTPTVTPTISITPTMTVTPNTTVTPTMTQTVTPNPTVTPTMTITPTVSGIWGLFTTDFGPEFE